jgi:two-component system, sensor histidine kinase
MVPGPQSLPRNTSGPFISITNEITDARYAKAVKHMKRYQLERTTKLVVVLDDDPLVLEATEGLLRSWGCRVITAKSYREAIARLGEAGERPDLIVCDYRLPHGVTGVDAIQGLRNAFEIPALLLSGETTFPVTEGYRFLQKPVNAETLRAAVLSAGLRPQ